MAIVDMAWNEWSEQMQKQMTPLAWRSAAGIAQLAFAAGRKAESLRQVPEGEPVAWTIVGPDGKSSIGGWSDMSSHRVMSEIGILRDGHRYAYAYEANPAPPTSGEEGPFPEPGPSAYEDEPTPAQAGAELPEYSQGIMGDGAAILCDGVPMSIDVIVATLNRYASELARRVARMADLTCPFCNEDDFDEIGLCMHLSGGCAMYDRACRRTPDYIDQRAADRAIFLARQEKEKGE